MRSSMRKRKSSVPMRARSINSSNPSCEGLGRLISTFTSQFITAIPSTVRVLADRTSSRVTAKTAVIAERSPTRSGATISRLRTSPRSKISKESELSETFASCNAVSSGCGGGVTPCIAARVRSTRFSTRPAFHSLHAVRPVASPSAILSA